MTTDEVDQRLARIAEDVRAGQFVEISWHLFKLVNFPALKDEEAASLVGEWCQRHGFVPSLRAGVSRIGGKDFQVIYLMLTPQ